MYLEKIFILLSIVLLLFSCSKKEEISIIEDKELQLQMIDAYEAGVVALAEGNAKYAAKKFNEAETLYPQSEWAAKASLMAAYSYYIQDYYSDAIFQLKQFIKTYPKDDRLSYAHFLLGICYYETIVDEKKDLGSLLDAQEKFKFVIKNYPTTDFALDASFKLELIQDILASKEMYIGKHYIKKKKWIPAINRFKNVVENYDTTIYVEEALHRLAEIYYRIGLVGESKKYASVLGYNYGSNEWYKQTYKIYNKNYKNSKKQIKKKEGIIKKKFKSIFN
tara:strand:+ start:862 stop:1695 length:834 start_codon:yes stop_codon:yes gene_type:complete